MTQAGKTVKTKRPQACSECSRYYPAGTTMYRERGFYLCEDCMRDGGFPEEAFREGWRPTAKEIRA